MERWVAHLRVKWVELGEYSFWIEDLRLAIFVNGFFFQRLEFYEVSQLRTLMRIGRKMKRRNRRSTNNPKEISTRKEIESRK